MRRLGARALVPGRLQPAHFGPLLDVLHAWAGCLLGEEAEASLTACQDAVAELDAAPVRTALPMARTHLADALRALGRPPG